MSEPLEQQKHKQKRSQAARRKRLLTKKVTFKPKK